jgi:peptidoglycan/xylan/chitin deacetylase (PgdA/CDA1 family)
MNPSSKTKVRFLKMATRLGITRLWRAFHASGVPVIALHGVLPTGEARLFNATGKFMSPEQIRTLLERLSRTYRIVPLEVLVDSLLAGHGVKKALALTFDDGYANAYTHVLPILTKMGLPLTVFVTTGYVDSDRILWNDLLEFAVFSTKEASFPAGILEHDTPLTSYREKCEAIGVLKRTLKRKPLDEATRHVKWLCDILEVPSDAPGLDQVKFLTSDQISKMAGQGVGFGGHTVTHPILSCETRERVRTEVVECKKYLESVTGKTVPCFAYPSGLRGDFNDMVKHEVRDAGYVASFTGVPGLNRPGVDLF